MGGKQDGRIRISTFGETTALEATGQIYSHDERIRQLVAEIELADKGWFGCVRDWGASSGGLCGIGARIVLAAGAVNTKKIRLTSAVSILSSMDPIRLFPTICYHRCLVKWTGRDYGWAWFIYRVFPLFGYDLKRL